MEKFIYIKKILFYNNNNNENRYYRINYNRSSYYDFG